MFLSSTDQIPSNYPSSSSSSFLHLTNSNDELAQSHLSTFSIRDYAFSYRTKNFKRSWPFSSTSLQLCLKNGLSDPLPPIQTPEASSNKTHGETISYKRKSEKLCTSQTLVKSKEDIENGLLASGSKSTIQVANKNPKKKTGLIVESGACMDSGSKEDHSCLVAPSESMALRTCPICKAFSSVSNTTLNAHIDQCLSVDSGQQPISKPNRPRVFKPKVKVKLMIDIYAAAKVCTLEDLDKRNGTKWAMISSESNGVVSDDKLKVSIKGKKRSVLRACVKEDASSIGPVYIDDKGQKLRILSEVKKKTSDPSREHKGVSEGKGNKSSRKRLRGDKCYKYRNQFPQSKKLIVRKGNALKIPKYRSGNSEESRGMERSETPARDQSRIFNQQMPTKRRLSRNRNQKGVLRDQPSENGHSLSGDPLVLRGSSHVSTDLSETLSSPLYSQNSWRICRESQVSEKSWALSRRKNITSPSFEANPLKCSDKAFASEARGVMKLKKARLDFSENEDDDEDTGRWESEMTQERELTDYDDWDDNRGTFKVVLSSSPSTSGEDDDYESYEETGDNKEDDDMLEKNNDADVEFESMIYEQTCCQTAEQENSFMEVDPIPIPGPPGSFLPSPWDMGTDATETHGNSSVMTSQVLSSSQFDRTDRNSSESTVSAMSNFAAPETHSHRNIIAIDKRPSRFRDNDTQSCCCQRKDKAIEDTTFGQPPPHMIQQDLSFQRKSVATVTSNPVLRLMGKDLMVINQTQTPTTHDESSLKPPTSQFLDLSNTQQVSPYGGNSLSFDTSTSYYNIP